MTWRVVGDRRRLVVPVALAVGWELAVDDRVVVVHEVKTVEGAEVVVVKNADGSTEEIEIDREDTAENSVAQQSSVLPDSDTKTPAVETEEEVEEEVEE